MFSSMYHKCCRLCHPLLHLLHYPPTFHDHQSHQLNPCNISLMIFLFLLVMSWLLLVTFPKLLEQLKLRIPLAGHVCASSQQFHLPSWCFEKTEQLCLLLSPAIDVFEGIGTRKDCHCVLTSKIIDFCNAILHTYNISVKWPKSRSFETIYQMGSSFAVPENLYECWK